MAALTRRGIAAASLSSGTSVPQRDALLADLCSRRPATKLLFCTPELLATHRSPPPPAAPDGPYFIAAGTHFCSSPCRPLYTTQRLAHVCHEDRLVVAVRGGPLQTTLRT